MHMAHHDNPGVMAIRTKTHKLVYYYGCNYDGGYQTPPGWELYDLEADPGENHNVYDTPAYAEVRARLKQQLADLPGPSATTTVTSRRRKGRAEPGTTTAPTARRPWTRRLPPTPPTGTQSR